MHRVFMVSWLALTSSVVAQEASLQQTLITHDKTIFCVAFSPDGHTLISGGPHKARLWDVATGTNTRTLDDAGFVRFVTFSPDGERVALSTAQGQHGTVKVWNLATGENFATLQTYNVGSFIVFGLDGQTLIWTDDTKPDASRMTHESAGETKIMRWNIGEDKSNLICSVCEALPYGCLTASGSRTKEEGTPRVVVALTFAADIKMLAARDNNGIVDIWKTASCKRSITFSANSCVSPFSMAFSPDGKSLALARGPKILPDGTREETMIDLRELSTGRIVASLCGHSAEVFAVAFSPDGSTLASCGYEQTIKLWDVTTRKNIADINSGSKTVNCVVFSPDGKTLASAAHDGTIRLWNVAPGRPR
jgi:WD40 repeat protein